MVRDDINQLLDGQRDLESKYQSVLMKKMDLRRTTKHAGKLAEADEDVLNTGRDLKNSMHTFGRSLRQNPITGDNTAKIQEDR